MTVHDAARDGAGASPSGVASARRAPWVVHPIIFGVFPIVALYAQNVYEARPRDLYWPIGMSLAGVAVVWLAARWLIRDRCRAGLIVSLAIGLFFTVSHASDALDEPLTWLTGIWVPRIVHVPTFWSGLLDVVLVLALSGLALWWRREQTLWSLTKYLNVFALILILMPIGSIFLAKRDEPDIPFKPAPPIRLAVSGQRVKTPDIYYIILDGFARSDVQKELFGNDLEPFLKRLEGRGFFVARHSTANYCQTPLCLSSSLNATYLDGLLKRHSRSWEEIGTLIGDGAVVRAARSQGYKFVTYATGFEQTENPRADLYLSPYPYLSIFHRMLLGNTPIVFLLPNVKERDSYTMTRERTLYLFDTLPEMARHSAPTFTFAHILAPHPPFVFGANGEDVSARETKYLLSDGTVFKQFYPGADYASGYRDEVSYLTKRVDEVIDKILASSPEPPVIILQSDHGSGSRLDTDSLEKSDVHERMSILNAYYLPGPEGRYAGLYDTITPVNSFRVVFNAYLGAKLPLLPDRNYFSTWADPFDFIDVTEQVRASQDRKAPKDDPTEPDSPRL